MTDCNQPRDFAAMSLKVAAKDAFTNREINMLLKDQGHEDGNLNRVVDALRKKTPKFVNQLGGGAADNTRRAAAVVPGRGRHPPS